MSDSKNQPESTWTFLLFIAMFFLMGWGLWHLFKGQILEVLRWLRFGELWTINLFTHQYGDCLNWLHYAQFKDPAPSTDMIAYTNQCFTPEYLQQVPDQYRNDYYTLAAMPMADIEREVTRYIHIPFAIVFGCIAIYIIWFSPRNQFKTRHNLESFIQTQARMWPVISPIVNFNPIKSSARIVGTPVPDKLPLFAEALSPEEWISWHRIPVTNGIPDREMTRRAFLLQLGPRWNGSENLPIHMQALFAAYALKGVQRREESDDLLGKIASCWSQKGGLKVPGKLADEIRKLIRDPEVGGKALEIADQHAYRTTAMLGVLRWARNMGGVLAPAQFLWCRAVDRALWYPLNNLGRRSFHSEGAGAMAHFMAEQNAKKALPIPRIDTAVVTLNQYLAAAGQPIPPREGDKADART